MGDGAGSVGDGSGGGSRGRHRTGGPVVTHGRWSGLWTGWG